MIDIIPYRTKTLTSTLSKQEIRKRLDGLLDQYHDIAGHTDNSTFIMERRIAYQNPFKPTVRGEIFDNQPNHQIILTFRPKTGVLIFYSALILVLIFGGIKLGTPTIFHDYPGRQFILGGLITYAVLMTGFNVERFKMEKRLIKQLD